MASFQQIKTDLEGEISKLDSNISQLDDEIYIIKNKERTVWLLGVLGLIIVIIATFIIIRVFFPDEVTKKDMGEFVYYGPIDGGEPEGIGVAVYPENDPLGRLYYYGNFHNGYRIDENATMFYKNGSYFTGSIIENERFSGIYFSVNKDHFVGDFKNDVPWSGTWYKHEKVQTIQNGTEQ